MRSIEELINHKNKSEKKE